MLIEYIFKDALKSIKVQNTSHYRKSWQKLPVPSMKTLSHGYSCT